MQWLYFIHKTKKKEMIDDVMQILQDGGASKTSKTGIYISIVLIVLAVAIFVVLYLQYKKVRKERLIEQQQLLIRKGKLDLCQFVGDDGTINSAAVLDSTTDHVAHQIDSEQQQQQQQHQQQSEAGGGIGNQIIKVIENGQLIKVVNGFSVMHKKIEKNVAKIKGYAPPTPEEQAEMDRAARLHDEAVNPLFGFRQRLYESSNTASENNETEPESDESSSSDDDE